MQGGVTIICEAFQYSKTDMRKIIVLPKLVDSKTGWMYIGLHRNQTQTGIINTELMHLFVNQTANYMNVTRGALL